MNYKERPRCRKVIVKLLEEGHTLHSIAYWSRYNDLPNGEIVIEFDDGSCKKPVEFGLETPIKLGFFSDGLVLQAKKMLEEFT